MVKQKKLLLIGVACSILITIFFTQLISSVIIFIQKVSTGFEKSEIVTRSYRHIQLNRGENETSTGFVTLQRNLEPYEYISYKDEFGNDHLISNFETNRYKCFGSCYCDTTKKRRGGGTTTVLSRQLTYLLVAVSSIIAYEKAKSAFEKDCFTKFVRYLDKVCPEGEIKSDVDKCVGEFDVIEEEEMNKHDDTKGIKRGTFWCKGHCYPREFLESKEQTQRAIDFECEEIEYEGEVKVDFLEDKYLLATFEEAKKEFQHRFLMYNCEQTSKKREIFYMDENPKGTSFEGGPKIPILDHFVYLCTGCPYDEWVNPSINCVVHSTET